MTTTTVKHAAASSATIDRGSRRRSKPIDWVGVGLWISLLIVSLMWLTPFVFILLTSVKSQSDIVTNLPWTLPGTWQFDNYARAAETGDIWTLGLNSALIAVVKVPLGIFIAALCAFALARLKVRLHRVILGVIAMGALVPVQVALGPLFSVMLQLDLLNTKLGLLLPYLAFGISFQVFILYGFFRSVPRELDEAAIIDGASSWRLFWQIVLPLAKPALAALFILDFVGTWNEYAMALTLLQTRDQFTVPLGITSFQSEHGADYGAMNAYIVLSILPVLLVYLLFQRYFVNGAFSGAVKG